jgi:hypothetical protein
VGNNINILPEVTEWEGVEWIKLAQDRDKWWILVHTVINILVP